MNIALGRPARQRGADLYPTSGASRAVDGVFYGGPNNENCAQVRYGGVKSGVFIYLLIPGDPLTNID